MIPYRLISVSAKNTPLDKTTLWMTSFQNTKSVRGEKLLPLYYKTKAGITGTFFTDTDITGACRGELVWTNTTQHLATQANQMNR
jgi:hypothetical protein